MKFAFTVIGSLGAFFFYFGIIYAVLSSWEPPNGNKWHDIWRDWV